MKKRLIIIDSHSLIHRAYHALPKLTTGKGELVNAVYGVLLAFFRTVKEFNPDYIAACFDLPGPTFRHEEFKEYKATRPKTPDELCDQIPKVKQVFNAFSVPVFEKQGFEADDLLATIARKSQIPSTKSKTNSNVQNSNDQNKEKIEIIILSADLDLLQVVDDNTKVLSLKRGIKNTILYDAEKVFERYGFSPAMMPDFKALVGDASDNIPGVPGIGEKTATALIKEFGSLEKIYENLDQISRIGRMGPILRANKEQAFLSKMLAQVHYDAPVDFDLEKCAWKNYDKEKAKEILEKFEFYSLVDRMPGMPEKKSRTLFDL